MHDLWYNKVAPPLRAAVGRTVRLPLPLNPLILQRHLRTARRLRYENDLCLHLGCGRRRIDGFVNIDLNPSAATDYVGSIVELPCRTGSVKRIETYHVIEHLSHRVVKSAVANWHAALSRGGSLIIECPNFDEAVREYLGGCDGRLMNIFGLQRFPGDTHVFGYNATRLRRLLEEVGFREVVEEEPIDYHTASEPCIRVRAVK